MAEIHLRRLLQQPALGFELHAPDEQVAAIAHVGADRALNAGDEPEPDHRPAACREPQRCRRASAMRLTSTAPR